MLQRFSYLDGVFGSAAVARPEIAPEFSYPVGSLSAGSGGLPSGSLLGVWYGKQYATSPRPYIPNAVSAVAPKNLLSAPRRLFSNTTLYTVSNATVTDSNASAADGTNDATTVVWGSVDGYVQSTVGAEIPNATYTLSVDVTTTDASTVNFRMGPNGSMTTKQATPSWQTFSVTFTTAGAPNLFIVRSVDSVTPANLKIINARLHPGSVDLGVDPINSTLMMGINAWAKLPTVTGGQVDTSSGTAWGYVQIPAAITGAFTAIVVSQRKGTTGNIAQAFLSNVSQFNQFSAQYSSGVSGTGVDGGACDLYLGGSEVISGNTSGLWSPKTGMWETYTSRYDGSNILTSFLNDSKVVSKAGGAISFSAADFYFNRISATTTSMDQAMTAMALYSRALSDVEVVQAVNFLKAQVLADNGISVNVETKFLCSEGDSITNGVGGAFGYPSLYGANSTSLVGFNPAAAGATLAGNGGNSLYGRQTADNAMIPTVKNGRMYIYTIMIGRNELVGYSGGNAQYAADIATFAGLQKAAGWDKIVLITLLPSTLANYNTARNAFNAIVTAGGWAAGHNIDAICDMAADLTMGPDAAASNVALYGDGTHPTTLGYTTLEPIYRATINGL